MGAGGTRTCVRYPNPKPNPNPNPNRNQVDLLRHFPHLARLEKRRWPHFHTTKWLQVLMSESTERKRTGRPWRAADNRAYEQCIHPQVRRRVRGRVRASDEG